MAAALRIEAALDAAVSRACASEAPPTLAAAIRAAVSTAAAGVGATPLAAIAAAAATITKSSGRGGSAASKPSDWEERPALTVILAATPPDRPMRRSGPLREIGCMARQGAPQT